MALWLVVFAPFIFLVTGWAGRDQRRLLWVAGIGMDQIAGRVGVVTDVHVKSAP